MKKKSLNSILIATLVIFGFSNSIYAQDFVWAKTFGGAENADFPSRISVDAEGNVYTVGSYSGSVDFDPGVGIYNLTSSGGRSSYISKLNANGNFVWAKSMGNGNQVSVSSITVDANGTVYISGGFNGTVDFDLGTGTFNMTAPPISAGIFPHFFILKLDANGNFIWAKSFGGTGGITNGGSIALDASGNIFTSGSFIGTVDFDPGASLYNITATATSGTVFSNLFISKLDSNGNFIWAKSISGTNEISCGGIAIDDSGNVYTTGGFIGTSDFDPGAGSFTFTPPTSSQNTFISKLGTNGNFIWAKSFAGNYNLGASLAIDGIGNIYIYGGISGTTDFDPNVGVFNVTAPNGGAFITKLNSSGNFLWAKCVYGTYTLSGYPAMNLDALGNVYYLGRFGGSVDFDPGSGEFNLISIAGTNSTFISKLNTNGNFIWAKSFNDTNQIYSIQGVCVASTGELNITGAFSGSMDIDPNLGIFTIASSGYSDIFILQLNSCSNSSSSISPSACETYTSPSGNYTWTVSGTYNDTIQNSSGCDSIITINLTILQKPSFGFTTNGMVATFNIIGSNCSSFLWDFGNGNTSSINPNPIVTYATAGTYGVCLQCNGQPSACVQCINITVPSNSSGTTGIEDIQTEPGITIYPNPSIDIITIETDNNNLNSNYVILNSIGQQVLSGQLIDKKNTIDVRHLSSGFYLIRIDEIEGYSFKLMKN